MNATALIITLAISAIIVIPIIWLVALRTRTQAPPPPVAPQRPKALQNGMFTPIGRLPHNPPMTGPFTTNPLPPMQTMRGEATGTYHFIGRGTDKTLVNTICTVTGMLRATCTCKECKKEHGSHY